MRGFLLLSPFSSCLFFLFLYLLYNSKKYRCVSLASTKNCTCGVSQCRVCISADVLSQSLNLLDLPLPFRHDDNCSIGTIGGGGGRMPDAIAPHACSFTSSADYELALILKEIRFITDQVSVA